MKLHVLLAVTALLSAFLPRKECKAIGASSVSGALQVQLKQGLLLGQVAERRSERRSERLSDDAPISLDLTFHLLREVLQMARAEQLAQQASSNRRMMDKVGK